MTGTDVVTSTAKALYVAYQSSPDVDLQSLLVQAVRFGIEIAGGQRKPTIGGLTARQRQLLQFIIAYTERVGFAPSFDEMRGALGLNSKSGVHRIVRSLEERGAISVRHNRARAIDVLAVPA